MRRLLPLFALLALGPSAASARDFSITSSASYSAGRYGGTESSRVASASLGAAVMLGNLELGVALPYLTVAAGSDELTISGVVIRPEEKGRLSGFSDASVTAALPLPLGDDAPFDVSVQGELKLPTGSRRFSTGKVDGGIDVEVSRQIGAFAPFLSLGHRFYGDAEDLELSNGWAASAGTALTLSGLTFIASYDWSSSPIGLPDAQEVFAVVSGPAGRGWNWTLYGSKGLSAGSADLMLGLGITRSFEASRR